MSATGALVSLGAGCGSRTSMLDADAYSSEGVGGFGNKGGASNNGATGGKGGDPDAVDPKRSASACESYCKGFKAKCAAELDGRDCMATCAREVNGKGKKCQTLGIKALECLAPHFSASSSNRTCDAAQSNGAAACQQPLSQFSSCFAPTPEPGPNPDPKPSPDPGPGPGPGPGMGLVNGCEAASASQPDMCIRYYTCADGPYLLECVSQLDGTYSCSCSFPSGVGQGAVYGASSDPCLAAGQDCGFY